MFLILFFKMFFLTCCPFYEQIYKFHVIPPSSVSSFLLLVGLSSYYYFYRLGYWVCGLGPHGVYGVLFPYEQITVNKMFQTLHYFS